MHCPSSSRREWSLSADVPRPLARQSGVGGKRLSRTLGIKIKRTPEEAREQTRRRVQRFRERPRVVVIIAVLALALLQQPVQAQPLEQERATARACATADSAPGMPSTAAACRSGGDADPAATPSRGATTGTEVRRQLRDRLLRV
jgi:hypothetical protein